MATDFDSLLRRLPSSSLIHFCDAKEIAAEFGKLVTELNDPGRYTLDDKNNRRVFSLPAERLIYSKQQIQTALAVCIAELVVQLTIDSTSQDHQILDAMVTTSGDLAYFTRKPVAGFLHSDIQAESTYVYSAWKRKCELCLANFGGEAAELRKNATRWMDAITKYWGAIDRMILDLLNDATLAAIRAGHKRSDDTCRCRSVGRPRERRP